MNLDSMKYIKKKKKKTEIQTQKVKDIILGI